MGELPDPDRPCGSTCQEKGIFHETSCVHIGMSPIRFEKRMQPTKIMWGGGEERTDQDMFEKRGYVSLCVGT